MMNPSLRYALVAALSGFLFGFDTAVISGAEQAVQSLWAMSDWEQGVAVSAALWGTVLGAVMGGWPLDQFGRKSTLIQIGVLYAVSAIGSAMAWDPLSFMAFRFVGGIAIGVSSVAAPAYIAEIAPTRQRGRLVSLFQAMIVSGILVAFQTNYLIASSSLVDSWRWMLGLAVVPSLAFLVTCFFIPESPRWLLTRLGDEKRTREILDRIDPETAERTLADIRAETVMGAESRRARAGWSDLGSPELRTAALFAFLIAAFNQLSGINAIIYFAPRIFSLAGAGENVALVATVGVGTINLIATMVGVALIDKLGRRTLMTIGCIGYLVSLTLTAYGFSTDRLGLVVPFILLFIAAHAVGSGAVIWVYISEIFPSRARGIGQSLGAGTHWVFAALLTLVMPTILSSVAPATLFAAFAGMMALQLLWVRTMMVETSGRSLEAVSADLAGRPA